MAISQGVAIFYSNWLLPKKCVKFFFRFEFLNAVAYLFRFDLFFRPLTSWQTMNWIVVHRLAKGVGGAWFTHVDLRIIC